MQRYAEQARTRDGRAIRGASVSVFNALGALATIYSDNGVTLQANPILTGLDGEYAFYAPNGRYSLSISATGYTAETVPGIVLYDPADDAAAQAQALEFNVKQFGAKGDGTTDDTGAIQAALDAAAVVATAQRPATVTISGGSCRVTPQTLHATGWRHCLLVRDNVRIVGDGCLLHDVAFSNRSLVILARGDNITVDGLRFLNTYVGTGNPFSVGVGAGDSYDSGAEPARVYRNLRVRNCEFYSCWLGASVQVSNTSNTGGWDGVRIEGCRAEARTGSTSGGNFNFRSEPEHRIKNADMIGCVAKGGTTASAFNYYGILGGCVGYCAATENGYAACELENATEQITVTALRSVRCEVGLWIDDSAFITADGLNVSMAPGSSLHALRITRGGTPTNSAYVTQAISVSNLISQLGRVRIEPFTPNNGAFGVISISKARLYLDGVNQSSGLFFATRDADLLLDDVWVYGVNGGAAFTGTMNSPGWLRMTGCGSRKIGSETSDGFNVTGTGGIQWARNDFHSVVARPTKWVIAAGNLVNGDFYESNIFGVRQLQGSGSPEGAVAAGPSSIYHRIDAGQLWLKASGISNTGWVQLT